jgi:hypothetical protein
MLSYMMPFPHLLLRFPIVITLLHPLPPLLTFTLVEIYIVLDNYGPSYVDVASPPLLLYSPYPPSQETTFTLVGTGTFNPPVVTITPSVSSTTFTFTPNVVGNALITAVLSGPGAAAYGIDSFVSATFSVSSSMSPLVPIY